MRGNKNPVMRKKKGMAGQYVLAAIMLVFVAICTLPFINVIAISLSSKSAILRGDVSLWPVEFTTKAYEAIAGADRDLHSAVHGSHSFDRVSADDETS